MAIAADQPQIEDAIEALECDLATLEGVDRLYSALGGRPVDVLIANAGRGLGKVLLDRDFADIRRAVDTNITGTIYFIHKTARDMRGLVARPDSDRRLDRRCRAGAFSAVENASAFIDSFSFALRNER